MIKDGRVTREGLRAWKLLFGADLGLVSAGAHPLLGRSVGLRGAEGAAPWIDMTTAVQMTLLSPIMLAGVSSAHSSVQFVSGKRDIPVVDLMTTSGNVQGKFAQLVAAEITVQKKRNSNFSNQAQYRAAQLSLRTLKLFFRNLCYSKSGILQFCGQEGEDLGLQPPKHSFHSVQPTPSNLFPYLSRRHLVSAMPQ